MTDVSVLGMGIMGAAIAQRLLAEGKTVTVWNRTAAKCEPLFQNGAVVAKTAREALEASPVSLVAIVDYDAVWEHVGMSGADLSKVDVVNLTSGSLEQALALAEKFNDVGGRLLEGCILTYPSEIGTPDAPLKYSGNRDAWERNADTLQLLGGLTEYVGDGPALANVFDVTVLAFYASAATAVLEASAYARTQGLDFATVEPTLHANVLLLDTFIGHAGQKIANGDYSVDDASLGIYLAALEDVVAAFRAAKFPSRIAVGTRDAMRLGVEAGRAHDDLFALYDVLSNQQEEQ
jgi:3-hydroxyisobutyrate dehydrogenase-like beta-hydroxyacid dehydrogenase